MVIFRGFSSSSSPSGASRLEGKVAVVTGSTDGIGLAIAERFAREGAKVMVSSRKETNVVSAVESLKARGLICEGTTCHVGRADHRQRLIQNTLDTFGAWDKIFEVNVKASLMLSKLVVPHMRDRGGGAILYVSSILGYTPFHLLGAYSVSKTALLGLTKVVATAVSDDNIRVNCLAPGLVKTKFSSALWQDEDISEQSLAQVPAGRYGTPEEMGAVAAFLCSDEAAYIQGESLVAAGGMTSHL